MKAMKKYIQTAFFLVVVTITSYSQENIYPSPVGLAPSTDYRVWVNGKEVFVYASPVPAAYSSFEISGPITVTIKASRDIKWVDVRPLSQKIKPYFKDSTISLRISKPVHLSVELNGSIKTPLFLFANPPEKNKPVKTNSDIIYFEAGKIHYPGIIEMKSNQTLYIEGGAIVTGVVKAKNAKNITIAGHGILDGSFNQLFNDEIIKTGDTATIHANKSGSYKRFIDLDNCEDVTIENITLHNSTSWQIVPVNCRNVRITNIKIVSDNASDDGIDVVHSKEVTIENSFIRTKDDCVVLKAYLKKTNKPGTNGIPIQSPSTYKNNSIDSVQDVEGVIVRNCVFWNALWGNALEIGFELNGADVKKVRFSDCDIIHVEAGAVLSIHNAGRSTVSDIRFEDIRIEDARQKLFDIAIFRSQYSEDGVADPIERTRLYLNGAWDGVLTVPPEKKEHHAQFRGQVRNIHFKDINIVDGSFPYSVFYGFDEKHPVQNVSIENLFVHKRKIRSIEDAKLYTEHTRNVTVK